MFQKAVSFCACDANSDLVVRVFMAVAMVIVQGMMAINGNGGGGQGDDSDFELGGTWVTSLWMCLNDFPYWVH